MTDSTQIPVPPSTTLTPLDARRQKLKDDFLKARGYWASFWDGMLVISPEYIEAFLNLASVPSRTGTLEAKVRELIVMAINASTTHMYEPGLRIHLRNALRRGASPAEITEVLQLITSQGLHTYLVAMPLVVEEFQAAGRGDEVTFTLNAEQTALKNEFIATCGFWTDEWQTLLGLDPSYFEACVHQESIPWECGPLPPKVKDLILMGVSAAATHLCGPAIRVHMRNAIGRGATLAEVLEVLQLVSVLGIHSCTVGMPVLVEELAAFGTPI